MRLHSCITKPWQNSNSTLDYLLINDGCEIDANTHIMSQSAHQTTFMFQDFEYSDNPEGLDVYFLNNVYQDSLCHTGLTDLCECALRIVGNGLFSIMALVYIYIYIYINLVVTSPRLKDTKSGDSAMEAGRLFQVAMILGKKLWR
ncbi:hypothetical protein DPMN_103496 [Dreissena polymorpha]|uniref:ZP domain-containing protein n=1 Tax=Dreissena polymorpha TaxID=45954 RepID=A0A9D4JZ83_DREPO|nr:hypothetical protein DPMN_103496 [Dreissena polymorpha]